MDANCKCKSDFHITSVELTMNNWEFCRKIVQKINETFEIFTGFKTLLKTWNENYPKTVKSMLLDESNQEFLKEMFTAEEGSIWSILGNKSERGLKFQTFKVITFLCIESLDWLGLTTFQIHFSFLCIFNQN